LKTRKQKKRRVRSLPAHGFASAVLIQKDASQVQPKPAMISGIPKALDNAEATMF